MIQILLASGRRIRRRPHRRGRAGRSPGLQEAHHEVVIMNSKHVHKHITHTRRYLHEVLDAEDNMDEGWADEAGRKVGDECLRLVSLMVASRGLLTEQEFGLALDAVVGAMR